MTIPQNIFPNLLPRFKTSLHSLDDYFVCSIATSKHVRWMNVQEIQKIHN